MNENWVYDDLLWLSPVLWLVVFLAVIVNGCQKIRGANGHRLDAECEVPPKHTPTMRVEPDARNGRIPMTGFPTIDSGIYPDPHVEEVYSFKPLEEANLFEGLTQNEYEKIVKAVADRSVPEVYLEEANLFEGLTQNEYEKIVKAVSQPPEEANLFADLWHNIITNASSKSLVHDKYYDAYHELKDAAIALVRRLELDQDVKKNNWWLNERAKIMEVIDETEDGGCDEN